MSRRPRLRSPPRSPASTALVASDRSRPEQQRERGVGGGGGRGVARRERRAGEAGELVDGRSSAIDEPLHEVGDGELTGDDGRQEREDGPRP